MQKIIPAILTKEPEELQRLLLSLKDESKWMHIDIADGKFVPNTTISLFELREAYEYFNLEIHLMVQDPEKYFEDCNEVGAKRVIFHYEASDDISAAVKAAQKYGFQKGLAFNPETAIENVQSFFQDVDSLLLMGVDPGFQGGEFVPETIQRVQQTKQVQPPTLGVDGGVGEENIRAIFEAGADYVVSGSAIMKKNDPKEALRKLQEMII